MAFNLSKTIRFVIVPILVLSYLPALLLLLVPGAPSWVEIVSPIPPLAIFGGLYTFFDKRAWRWGIFRWLGVVNVPDLRGRWKGTLNSSFEENGIKKTVPMYLEISQTFSRISVNAYYERSESHSVAASFTELTNETHLYYTYDNDPHPILKTGTMQKHPGTAKLKCLPSGEELKGPYFNGIGNVGEINLKFERRNLIGKFGDYES